VHGGFRGTLIRLVLLLPAALSAGALAVSSSAATLASASSAATLAVQLPDGLYAEIHTSKGTIVARLEPSKTPMTVANFVGLAEGTIANRAFDAGTPYYDGSVFHRVVPGHVIQAGAPDPNRSAARGPGYTFPNEIHADLSHDHAGALGMANGGPHTNSAQFYITLGDRSYLDGDYIVFGEVVSGMAAVIAIEQGDVIESVRIVRVGAEAEAFQPDTATFEDMVAAAEARVENDAIDRRRLEREYIELTFSGVRSVSETGLQYIIQRRGSGRAPAADDRLSVRYVATALRYRGHMMGVNGPLFDAVRFASSPADGTPQNSDLSPEFFEYEVGSTKITPGLDETIANMLPGEQRIVIVPAELAYGRSGYYGPNRAGEKRLVVPPETIVVYGVEVLDR
jgi:peptidylprolyl isomerase